MPNFWFGIVLVLLFAVTWQLFPAGGFPGWREPLKSVHALILPALSLSLGEIAILTRVTRSAMLDTLREDYVRTARAKGAPERTVLFRHALRNALIPVTTVAGLIAGFLVAGAVIIESVFRLPGVGQLVYDSINNRDLIVIKNVVILFTILVLVRQPAGRSRLRLARSRGRGCGHEALLRARVPPCRLPDRRRAAAAVRRHGAGLALLDAASGRRAADARQADAVVGAPICWAPTISAATCSRASWWARRPRSRSG